MVRQVLAVDEEAPTPVHRLAYACAEDPAHAPPPTLLEETLLEEDRAATDRRRASLKLGPFERDGLGLAFSGGGVRAASFQSGVLWRMAELNLLKEVDHLSAVSGGGYPASALLTHISYGDEPLTAEHADSWYARKTASLIARCQDNIGYLMTFAHSQCKPPPGGRTYGSDLPRSCDLPGLFYYLSGCPSRTSQLY